MTKINWPAILIQPLQGELIYLETKSDWLIESEHAINENCQLIDLTGVSYQLHSSAEGAREWEISGKIITLKELIALIKVHTSLVGHCCSAKLGAKDFPQAFEVIRYLENEN